MHLLWDQPFSRLFAGEEAGAAAPATDPGPAVGSAASAFPDNPDLGGTGGPDADFDFPSDEEIDSIVDGIDGPSRPAETGAAKTGAVATPPGVAPAVPAAPGATAAPAPQTPPLATAPAVPTVQVPPGAPAPAAAQPAAPAPTAQPEQVGPQGSGSDPRQSLMGLIDQSRQQWHDELVKSTFALTKDEADQLDSGDLATVIPQLQTRVFIEAVRSTVAIVEAALPGMVLQGIAVQQAQKAGDEAFYGPRPELVPHRAQIQELARTIRQLNPSMSREDFFQKLDQASRVMFGVAPAAPAPNGNGAQPQVSAAPAVRIGGAASPVISRAPTGVPTSVDPNDWGSINSMFDLDT